MFKQRQTDMLNGIIWKEILLFFVPIMFGSIFQQLYNTADSLIVGNYLGDAYDDSQPLDYFLKSKEKLWFIHPQTKKELEALLRILNDHGEEKLLHYIKYRYLRGETRKIKY